jgi:pentatricopeptide repeat protein
MLYLLKYYPKEDWRDGFLNSTGDSAVYGERILKIYLLMAAWAVINTVAAVYGTIGIALAAAVTFDYFLGLFILCKMINSGGEQDKMQAAEQNLNDLQDFMYTIRSQRHDYNFHVHTIRGLLQEKKYDKCMEYLNDMVDDSIAMNDLLMIKDAAISAQIYSFRLLAASKGIHMEIEILNDLSALSINPYETNKIIGNLLQNAIDECELLTDKSYGIKLSIFKKGEYCVITVSNRLCNRRKLEQLKSGESSKGGTHEGVGLVSMKLLVSKYNGAVYHRVEDGIIYYTVRIPLKVL